MTLWRQMFHAFTDKFFCEEEHVSIISLSQIKQRSGEDLVGYVRRFRERTMEYLEPIAESKLVDLCVAGMLQTFKPYVVIHTFNNFSRFIEATRRISDSITQPPNSASIKTP